MGDPLRTMGMLREQFIGPALRRVTFPVGHAIAGFPTVHCFPEVPRRWDFVFVKMCHVLGVRLVGDASASSRSSLVWYTSTRMDRDIGESHAINARCLDVGKDFVDRLFAEVAGYGLQLDPRTHDGPMVRKSIENARHDGEILEGPIQDISDQHVYQRLVNNTIGGQGLTQDIRVPIVGGNIPFVYLLTRSEAERFKIRNLKAELVPGEAALSREEIALVTTFAQRAGLDFGEIDVLRDRDDGRIYIVDISKTPFGPPKALDARTYDHAVHRLADLFSKRYLRH